MTAWNVTSTTHHKSTAFTLNCPFLYIQKKSHVYKFLKTSYFCLVSHYTLNLHNNFFPFFFFYLGLWPKPTVSICIWHKTFDGPLLKVNKLLGRLQVGGLNMFLFFLVNLFKTAFKWPCFLLQGWLLNSFKWF